MTALHRWRRIACVIHFGTRRAATLDLAAHAWVDAGPVAVIGYPVARDLVEVACLTG